MNPEAEAVKRIITNKGKIWFNTAGSSNVEGTSIKPPVQYKYMHAVAVASESELVLKYTASESEANAVNVLYGSKAASIADFDAPGYIFSESFSGCVFYLFRSPVGSLHAVHAYRGDGQLADPTQYFSERGGKLLYKWDSQGKMSDKELAAFETGTVLVAVGRQELVAFAFTTKNGKVVAPKDEKHIVNWLTAG